MKKMKSKIFFLVIACSFQQIIFAQNIGINSTGTTPDKSAILDVSATDKGMLVPRMTTAQRTAINSPAKGLLVYQTEAPSGFYFYDGASWNLLVKEIPGKFNFNFKSAISLGFNANQKTIVTYDVQKYLNNVNFSSNTFTAPSSGIYSLTTNLYIYGNSATTASMGFYVNNVANSTSNYNIVSGIFQNIGYTDNILLQTGDKVTVQIKPGQYISGLALNFSGFKIN